MLIDEIQKKLNALGNSETAAFLQGFFKTAAGEYGEGDCRNLRTQRFADDQTLHAFDRQIEAAGNRKFGGNVRKLSQVCPK